MTGDVAPEPTDDVRAPDVIEPITAFRAWVSLDPGMLLRSLNGGTRWIPGYWMTAQCSIRNHGAPQEGCGCGFYATKGLEEVLTIAGPMHAYLAALARVNEPADSEGAPLAPVAVVGRVHLAGKVIEHAHGYRAERARVAEIIAVSGWSESAGPVAETYGVPLGEVVPAASLPDFNPLPSVAFGCPRPSSDPKEPTIIGRLSILAFSLLLFVGALLGIAGNHRLDGSDWFLCLVVIGSMLATRRAIATLPRAMRGSPVTMQGPPAPVPGRPRSD